MAELIHRFHWDWVLNIMIIIIIIIISSKMILYVILPPLLIKKSRSVIVIINREVKTISLPVFKLMTGRSKMLPWIASDVLATPETERIVTP